MADDLSAVARFLYEAGTLKHTRRTGWWMAGVNDPESVAEHSWRTSIIASVIVKLEGADPARAAFLAVWHDTQETRTGDVNHLGKKYAPAGDPQAVTADQTTGMPDGLASAIRELVAEYETKDSPEAICARDADKLECMLQGIESRPRATRTRSGGSTTVGRGSPQKPGGGWPTSCSHKGRWTGCGTPSARRPDARPPGRPMILPIPDAPLWGRPQVPCRL